MTDVATPDDREEFWDRLEDVRTGMLETGGRFVPMSHSLEPEDGKLWFLTAKDTPMAKAAAAGAEARYVVSSDAEGIYASVKGRLMVSNDRAILDEVWSAMAAQWFEQGKEDPDLALIALTPAAAEVWLGPESGLQFLMQMAKAKLTGDEPDLGRTFELSFT